MGHKHWTEKELKYVKQKALLDATNSVVNVKQMAKYLKRSPTAVNNQITKLRKEGILPPIQRDKAIDSNNRPYSEREIKRVAAMLKNGSTAKEIADSLDRTEKAIHSLITRLRKKGVIDVSRIRSWQPHEEEYIIHHIEFDEYGYVSNAEVIANFLNRSVKSVIVKISRLRNSGLITVHADRTKTSVKAKKAHEQFNNKRFAQYGRRVSIAMNTPSKVEVVQVVHTVIVSANGEEIHQYWTFEGRLLAENKKILVENKK